MYLGSRDRAVNIMTLYRLGDPGGSNSCMNDTSPKRPDRPWVPRSILLNGYQGTFLGVKQPQLEDNYLSPPSVQVKKGWSCTSTPPVRLCVVDRENIYLLLRHAYFCCYVKDANSNIVTNISCRKSNFPSTDFSTNVTGNVQVTVPEFLGYSHFS
jgi:hypothetical protein